MTLLASKIYDGTYSTTAHKICTSRIEAILRIVFINLQRAERKRIIVFCRSFASHGSLFNFAESVPFVHANYVDMRIGRAFTIPG
jgi:hypothetical protein